MTKSRFERTQAPTLADAARERGLVRAAKVTERMLGIPMMRELGQTPDVLAAQGWTREWVTLLDIQARLLARDYEDYCAWDRAVRALLRDWESVWQSKPLMFCISAMARSYISQSNLLSRLRDEMGTMTAAGR